MEINGTEVQLIKDAIVAVTKAIKELSDLEMLSVGGGCATVDFG